MNSAARFLVLATACATLLAAGATIEPASAQEVCKDNTVTASGRGKFRPFTKTKELEGRGSAMADAVVNWQKEVREKYGDRWDSWSRAKGTNFECAPTTKGKIIGTSFIGCTISGRPCSNGSSSKDQVVEERERDRGRNRNRDRDGADDGDRRDRGDGYRRRPRTAYDMEMAYQDRLAERRKRAEARLWAREEIRQKYLARQREWADTRAFRRSTYYGEYGTYRRYRAYDRYRSYRHAYRHYGHHHYGYRHYNNYDRSCDCAPYGEYRFAPLFDFGFFHRSSYHCAEP